MQSLSSQPVLEETQLQWNSASPVSIETATGQCRFTWKAAITPTSLVPCELVTWHYLLANISAKKRFINWSTTHHSLLVHTVHVVRTHLYCAITVAYSENTGIIGELQAVYALSFTVISVLELAISLTERHQWLCTSQAQHAAVTHNTLAAHNDINITMTTEISRAFVIVISNNITFFIRHKLTEKQRIEFAFLFILNTT